MNGNIASIRLKLTLSHGTLYEILKDFILFFSEDGREVKNFTDQ